MSFRLARASHFLSVACTVELPDWRLPCLFHQSGNLRDMIGLSHSLFFSDLLPCHHNPGSLHKLNPYAHPNHKQKRSCNGLSAASVKHFPYHRANDYESYTVFFKGIVDRTGLDWRTIDRGLWVMGDRLKTHIEDRKPRRPKIVNVGFSMVNRTDPSDVGV